ncbi:hypothetical protein ElyMa_005325000 [Elysia marginata]|uniref:Bulb-type lectin domain-containing protein n=1 Tax=Elysia marginata TaxID=1093978 RepID=A0AAV4K1Y4_9GAST|nr:hypothetical protein ElyMa_005325000 [Elysia marginata]
MRCWHTRLVSAIASNLRTKVENCNKHQVTRYSIKNLYKMVGVRSDVVLVVVLLALLSCTLELEPDSFITVGNFDNYSSNWGYDILHPKDGRLRAAIDNQTILLNWADDPLNISSMSWRTSSTPDIAFEFATGEFQGKSGRTVGSQL